MNWPSPSSHDRVAICTASAALPQAQYVGDDQWTSRGTVLHRYLCDVINHGMEVALGNVPAEFRAACEAIDLNALPASSPEAYAAEVTIAINVDTMETREIGRRLGRQQISQLIGGREMAGTLDVVGLTSDLVDVIDYKTGYHRYDSPDRVRQLRSYALLAARAYNRPRARVTIIRIGEDGQPWKVTAPLDEFELATVETELREMVEKITVARDAIVRGVRLVPVMGTHCRYCPAFDSCPAQMSLIRQVAGAAVSIEDEIRAAILNASEEQLAEAWVKVTSLERVTARAKDILKDRARRSPIPLTDGYVLGLTNEEHVNEEVAPEVLAVLYGDEVATSAVEIKKSISKASIDRALRKHVLQPGMKITHLMRETVNSLREAGGLKLVESVEKHKPKELPPEVALAKAVAS